MKTEQRDLARALRATEGASIKEIARRLRVSTSSVSTWVRDIALTDEQHAALRARNPIYNRQCRGSAVASANRRADRLASQIDGRRAARRGDPLYVAGCMLYWAEGAKDRNQLQLANADPELVRFFVTFLRTYFDLRDEDIKITCHLFADHLERQREVEQFWLDTLRLPPDSLRKSVVNVYSRYSKRKRIGNLPWGTCRVVVSRTHVVQSIYGAIQEYAGFHRPEWLE